MRSMNTSSIDSAMKKGNELSPTPSKKVKFSVKKNKSPSTSSTLASAKKLPLVAQTSPFDEEDEYVENTFPVATTLPKLDQPLFVKPNEFSAAFLHSEFSSSSKGERGRPVPMPHTTFFNGDGSSSAVDEMEADSHHQYSQQQQQQQQHFIYSDVTAAVDDGKDLANDYSSYFVEQERKGEMGDVACCGREGYVGSGGPLLFTSPMAEYGSAGPLFTSPPPQWSQVAPAEALTQHQSSSTSSAPPADGQQAISHTLLGSLRQKPLQVDQQAREGTFSRPLMRLPLEPEASPPKHPGLAADGMATAIRKALEFSPNDHVGNVLNGHTISSGSPSTWSSAAAVTTPGRADGLELPWSAASPPAIFSRKVVRAIPVHNGVPLQQTDVYQESQQHEAPQAANSTAQQQQPQQHVDKHQNEQVTPATTADQCPAPQHPQQRGHQAPQLSQQLEPPQQQSLLSRTSSAADSQQQQQQPPSAPPPSATQGSTAASQPQQCYSSPSLDDMPTPMREMYVSATQTNFLERCDSECQTPQSSSRHIGQQAACDTARAAVQTEAKASFGEVGIVLTVTNSSAVDKLPRPFWCQRCGFRCTNSTGDKWVFCPECGESCL